MRDDPRARRTGPTHGRGALACAALANLVLAAGVAWWLRSQARDLLFAATLRNLRRTAGAVTETHHDS